ncbi:Cell differentiation protein RCD1 -like protein [Capsicum baccatum]|uniref:Cell differentiation protein RCD1-like protein n=1 Tax=Capsicum baccatum TaxID=33114 RepID=A0A2G2VRD9_CAPBA|nr:Cell differentiation protein RCD1 -like protein [Capsicum baccatum]
MVRNVPQSLSVGGSGRGGGASSSSHGAGASINMDRQMQVAEQLVLDLRYPVRRERALLELSKKRELFHDLAPLLCNSFGTSTVFLQAGDTEVIHALLSPEIIPSCLRSMDIGCELSKTVATFILQKILLDDAGLDYICTREVKFFDVAQALGNMVGELVEQPSSRLMKYIIRCYLRLSDNPRACDALGSCLPDMLRDTTFSSCLREDPVTRMWLQELLQKVDGNLDALQAGGSVSRIHSTRI